MKISTTTFVLKTALRRLAHAAQALSMCCSLAVIAAPICHASAIDEFLSLKEIREQGVVMQAWENSCAAASLATVLTYGFHDPVSEQLVALDMLQNTSPEKVKSRGGFSMLDMKNFAIRRGYQVDVFKDLSLQQLSVLSAPIVIVENLGVPHFVVFDRLAQDTVFLADPAFGNLTISAAQFQRIWSQGIALLITRQK